MAVYIVFTLNVVEKMGKEIKLKQEFIWDVYILLLPTISHGNNTTFDLFG